MSQGTSRIGNESPEQVLTYRGPQQEVLSNNFTTPGGRTCTIHTTDKARMRLTASAAGRASPGFSPSRGGVPPFSVMSMLPPQHPAVVRKSNSAMNRGFAKTARTRGCLDTAARWRWRVTRGGAQPLRCPFEEDLLLRTSVHVRTSGL